MSRVCVFGAFDPSYPRIRILERGLESAGIEVVEARVRERRAIFRYPALVAAFARVAARDDILLVPSFRHKDMPLASWLKGRRRLVFDPLVSRHDTLVRDWGIHAEGSGQARWNRGLDRLALSLADLVLCDTWAHGALYQSLGVERSRLRRVLVGAEDPFFAVADPDETDPIKILYLGGFLPLHGMPTVIEAAARLASRRDRLPDYTIELVGEGIDFAKARALAAGLERVAFRGRTDYAEAPRIVSAAHVVLGAFGGSDKAGRVIPHKVYQGLAAGRAVVTGDGEGLREVFEPGVHLLAVPRGDAEALAAALETLIVDPDRRRALGASGRARAREVATPERIGAELAKDLGVLPVAVA